MVLNLLSGLVAVLMSGLVALGGWGLWRVLLNRDFRLKPILFFSALTLLGVLGLILTLRSILS